jgi:hypothetical protein
MSIEARTHATTSTETRPDRGAASRPDADVASPLPVWRYPIVHAAACVGLGAAILLADVFVF